MQSSETSALIRFPVEKSYTARLQEVSRELCQKNRRLRKQHRSAGRKLISSNPPFVNFHNFLRLMPSPLSNLSYEHGRSKLEQIVKRLTMTDLQSQHQKWRSSVQEMGDIFKETERQGFVNLNEWRKHWDAQVLSFVSIRIRRRHT